MVCRSLCRKYEVSFHIPTGALLLEYRGMQMSHEPSQVSCQIWTIFNMDFSQYMCIFQVIIGLSLLSRKRSWVGCSVQCRQLLQMRGIMPNWLQVKNVYENLFKNMKYWLKQKICHKEKKKTENWLVTDGTLQQRMKHNDCSGNRFSTPSPASPPNHQWLPSA